MMPPRPMFVTGSLVHGGAERHAITVMNRLAERGHECHAVYVKDDPSQRGRIRLGPGGTLRCLNATRFLDPEAVGKFAAHLRRVQPGVLVTANDYALMNATLACLRAGLRPPIVQVFHTTRLFGLREQVKMLLNRPFFWQADCTVFVCAAQRRYWLRRALRSRRNEVIHNGVDTRHFSDITRPEERRALRGALGLAGSDFVVGLPAVLRPEKNPVQLVDAVALLRRAGIAASALLIGDGPLRGAVEARADTLGVTPWVRVTGLQQDVRPYLALCDAVTLCSLSETFSLAALEAMAMGRPVVLSDVGGAREMVLPGSNGFLYPAGDTAALAAALAALADGARARRMGRVARAVAETGFSEQAMLDRYETLLGALPGPCPAAG